MVSLRNSLRNVVLAASFGCLLASANRHAAEWTYVPWLLAFALVLASRFRVALGASLAGAAVAVIIVIGGWGVPIGAKATAKLIAERHPEWAGPHPVCKHSNDRETLFDRVYTCVAGPPYEGLYTDPNFRENTAVDVKVTGSGAMTNITRP